MSIASRPFDRRARRSALVAAVFACLLGLLLVSQLGGSSAVSQTRAVPPFSAVELAGDNLVTVHVGARQSVIVRAREDMLNHVTTRVRSDTLVIGNAPSPHGTKGPMSVSVDVPSLTSLAIATSGSGIVRVTGVNTPSFTVTLAGSGVLQASGTTTRLDVSLSGSGAVELQPLVARDVRAVLTGSGQIAVTAKDSLNASLPGNGAIRYAGDPARVATSVTGTGAIVPG
jgi:Putative auto-transporter adhesin, head GIN domain